eukprot:12408015-Karenia_brevis.AAC.1
MVMTMMMMMVKMMNRFGSSQIYVANNGSGQEPCESPRGPQSKRHITKEQSERKASSDQKRRY